jgi:hypothetical protein
MTKLIAAFIIIVVLYGAWQLFLYWDKVQREDESKQKQAVATAVTEQQLSGLPDKLGPSLEAAKKQGVPGLKNWLKTYGPMVQDPRKAWIELDYCVLLSREDLPEARRVFAGVKARTPQDSPIWPRLKQLEKTYE